MRTRIGQVGCAHVRHKRLVSLRMVACEFCELDERIRRRVTKSSACHHLLIPRPTRIVTGQASVTAAGEHHAEAPLRRLRNGTSRVLRDLSCVTLACSFRGADVDHRCGGRNRPSPSSRAVRDRPHRPAQSAVRPQRLDVRPESLSVDLLCRGVLDGRRLGCGHVGVEPCVLCDLVDGVGERVRLDELIRRHLAVEAAQQAGAV